MALKAHSFSLIKEITWPLILSLGADPFYYNIEKWIVSQSLDPIAIRKLTAPKMTHDELTLWRSIFLKELHDWSYEEADRGIADSLSLRCFVRVDQLNERTPTKTSMEIFWDNNERGLRETLAFAAAVWTQAAQGKPKFSRWTWIKLMDKWGQRTILAHRI